MTRRFPFSKRIFILAKIHLTITLISASYRHAFSIENGHHHSHSEIFVLDYLFTTIFQVFTLNTGFTSFTAQKM